MNPFRIGAQLPRTKQEIDDHIDALEKMSSDKGHARLFDHLYECLTILDDKSSTLLAFNSIIFAVYAIFGDYLVDTPTATSSSIALASGNLAGLGRLTANRLLRFGPLLGLTRRFDRQQCHYRLVRIQRGKGNRPWLTWLV